MDGALFIFKTVVCRVLVFIRITYRVFKNTARWATFPEFHIPEVWGEGQEFAFLTSSQVMLMLLVWGPLWDPLRTRQPFLQQHLEEHWSQHWFDGSTVEALLPNPQLASEFSWGSTGQLLLHTESFPPRSISLSVLLPEGFLQHQGILLSLVVEQPRHAGDLLLSVEIFDQQGMLLVDGYPSFPCPEQDSSGTGSLWCFRRS